MEDSDVLSIPVARKTKPTYENFEAYCPRCGHENIFNRASDLRTFGLIMGRNVVCHYGECGKAFRIAGDLVNSAWEMLLYECYETMDRKRYMGCILGVAQAYEVFFATFLRAQLLYKPSIAEREPWLVDLQPLRDKLYEKINTHTFDRMRNLVLIYVIAGTAPNGLVAAETEIALLPTKPERPKDTEIMALADRELSTLLLRLKNANANELRNRIVHKDAYRPSREEAEAVFEEARDVLFRLKGHLDISDDPVWYMRSTSVAQPPSS